jgi:hypothetical protein
MKLSRREFLLSAAGAAGALLIGCYNLPSDLPPYQAPVTRLPVPLIEDEVRLAAFGDWGVHNWNQYGVVRALDAVAAQVGGFHGGLLLGDNFYPSGVSGLEDPKWAAYFAELYDTEHLGALPWYAVLGNHDYGGDVEAQIHYTQRSGGRWNMPAHYYRKDFGPAGGSGPPLLTVLAIDTDAAFAGWAAQVAWLEAQLLSLAQAPQPVVVIGHHTILSYAPHGRTAHVAERIEPLLQRYRVAAYLCGHDHCMQINEDGGVLYAVLGGGGGDVRGVFKGPASRFVINDHGFGLLRVSRRSLVLEVRGTRGEVLHTWSRAV